MQINASATVTGAGSGIRATLAAASQARTLAGALSALHLSSDIGANNTMPTVHGFLRCTDDGSVRMSHLAVVPNASNGTLLATHTTDAMTHSVRCITEGGTVFYLMATTTSSNRGA
jgi:hypothetical protein